MLLTPLLLSVQRRSTTEETHTNIRYDDDRRGEIFGKTFQLGDASKDQLRSTAGVYYTTTEFNNSRSSKQSLSTTSRAALPTIPRELHRNTDIYTDSYSYRQERNLFVSTYE